MNSASRREVLKTAGILAMAGALGTPFSALGQESTPAAAPDAIPGGTLTVGTGRPNSQVFNPLNFLARNQQIINEVIFMRLVYANTWGSGLEFDGESDIDLAIAESLTEIEKDRVWEITLRDEITWHDGNPVVADDVILGTWLALHPEAKQSLGLQSPIGIKGADTLRAEGGTDIVVDGWTKLGEKALRLELETPIANYWKNPSVAYWPMPSHILGGIPVDQALSAEAFATNPVGNGPFKVSAYEPDQFMELVPYEDFSGGRPLLDKLVFRFGETDTLAAALEAQEIDLFDGYSFGVFGGTEFVELTSLPFVTTISPFHPSPWGMLANWERFPDQASAMIQAMMHAVDMTALNANLYGDTLTLTNNPFHHVAGYEPGVDFPHRGYDPSLAQQILADAGWDSSQELSFLVTEPTSTHTAISEMLNQVGLRNTFTQIDSTQLVEKRDIERDFDICLWDTSGSQDLLTIFNFFKSGAHMENGGRNYVGYANDEVDTLFQQAVDATSPEEQHAALDQILQIWAEKPAVGTLYYPSHPYIFNNRVQGALPGKAQASVRPAWERVWLDQNV